MSSVPPPPPPPPGSEPQQPYSGGEPSGNYRDAKAQAKAARAYAKAQRPWYKKKRYWLVAAVIVVIAASVASGGGSDEEPKPTASKSTVSTERTESKPTTSTEPTESEPTESEPAADTLQVDAGQIVNEFEQNELAADSKYKGKDLQITGKVLKIDTEFLDDDKYVLSLGKTKWDFLTVNCHDIPNDELATLQVGETATAIGTFDDGGDLGVEVNDCSLV